MAASYQNGLINGSSADKFAPGASISRQEMARIIANVLVKHGYQAAKAEQLEKFSDQAEIASWATEATALVVREGLIAGMEDGRFAPAENANRAQAAVMLNRLFNLIMQ